MANKGFYQTIRSKQPNLTLINGLIQFGTSGAPTAVGPGLSSVSRLAAGVFQVKLQDNFAVYLGANIDMNSAASGSAVNDGSLVVGTLYQITTLGTTNWATVGADSQYAPAVGQPFVATATSGGGNGTATAITPSGIIQVEVTPSTQAMMKNLTPNLKVGASLILSTYGLPASGTTPTLKDPANGSALSYRFFFRDSTVVPF